MAQSNTRYFNTFFFEDPYIEDLDADTTLLYLTLILNPHNNLAGIYEISLRKLQNYTKLTEDQIKIGIQKLTADRKILFSDNWLTLKNFIKNNEFNPNMCKKAYDIMKAAPKDKVLFALTSSNGDIEPWVVEFVKKVEKGINSTIDSQNRNAINYAKKHELPSPALNSHRVFNLETLQKELFSRKKVLLGGMVGGTIPFHQGEPSGEIEYEIESEIEIEKEFECTDEERSKNLKIINELSKNLSDRKKAGL